MKLRVRGEESGLVILPEYNGQRTDTSDPGRQEERMWRRRQVPEDAEGEDNNQKSKESRT